MRGSKEEEGNEWGKQSRIGREAKVRENEWARGRKRRTNKR